MLGILSFALLLFGHHLAGLAEIPEILLLAAGLALVALELFVIPGTGFAAIAGAVCVLAALILSLQDFTLPDPKGAPWEVDIMLGSVGRVMFAFIGAAVGFLLLMRFLPRVPFLQRLVLQADVGGMAPAPAGAMSLVGRKGHAVTPLHPGGMIEIDGETHDVVAEGDYVAKGEPVEVLKVEGMRIVVGKMKR
ncbi:MAG: NfeD family protein [Planctomycetes bacterium]|nr:NfeD family protein [Planctomycetota bacterium]